MKSKRTTFQLLIIVFILSFSLQNSLWSQNESRADLEQKYLITLTKRSGEVLVNIISETKDSVHVDILAFYGGKNKMNLHEGKYTFGKNQVHKVEDYEYEGRFDYWDRNVNRNIFSPTAKGLKKGDKYYQNVLVSTHLLHFGVTDYFTISAGLESLSLIIDQYPIFIVHPKFSLKLAPKTTLGLGIMSGALVDVYDLDFEVDQLVAVPYINLTHGSRDRNFTIGFGLGRNWENRPDRIIATQLAGNYRVHESIVIVTENTLFQNYDIQRERPRMHYAGVHGIRVLKRKSNVDFGLVLALDSLEDWVGFPYLGYARFF